MATSKILIVEDEKNIAKLLRFNLEKEGFDVVAAADGEQGLSLWRSDKPDLIILDVMLPKVDGFQFCKTVRGAGQTPILMLTAKKEQVDKLLGLELGADDYVTKPFAVREVVSRVKAILRRTTAGGQAPIMLQAGGLELDLERYDARVDGKPIQLSAKEFEFLRFLVQAAGRVLSRDDILEKLWGYDRSLNIDTRTVDQHVKRLRKKLGPEGDRIVTIKNVGYRFDTD